MKKDYINVKCCRCGKTMTRPRHRVRGVNSYCNECRNTTEITCCICGKKKIVWNSKLINYRCKNKKKDYIVLRNVNV